MDSFLAWLGASIFVLTFMSAIYFPTILRMMSGCQ